MNWQGFSLFVDSNKIVSDASDKGTMAKAFYDRGAVISERRRNHCWYPKGVKNDEKVNGFRYVDMNHSFFGEEPLLVSEASCCMIMILMDTKTKLRFAAHISAASDMNRLSWLSIKTDTQLFFKKIDNDVNRAELFLFSENVYWKDKGTFEQKNVMKLMNYVLSDNQLQRLAKSTWLVQGEAGVKWNPFCAVRLDSRKTMNISFVH